MHPARRSLLQSGTVDLDEIKRTEQRIHDARRALNTRTAYASAWRAFSAWCAAAGVSPLPADPRAVQDFSTWCFNRGYRLQTVSLRLSAILHYHREAGHNSPVDRTLREHIANAKRHLKEKPRGKAALTYDLLRRVARCFPETPAGLRNRAMILLGFASGWRRSEIVGLDYSEIQFVPRGMELWLRASKTDQTGAGRLVGIEPGTHELTCPVTAMRDWVTVRGAWQGPLFPKITPNGDVSRAALHPRGGVLYEAIKDVIEQIGEDPKLFGAHSLRSGMITEAARHGASESAIMQRTGHKCSEMVRRYIRPATAFDFNPLRGVL